MPSGLRQMAGADNIWEASRVTLRGFDRSVNRVAAEFRSLEED